MLQSCLQSFWRLLPCQRPKLEHAATVARQATLHLLESMLLQIGVDARTAALLAIETMITDTVLWNQVAPMKVIFAEGI